MKNITRKLIDAALALTIISGVMIVAGMLFEVGNISTAIGLAGIFFFCYKIGEGMVWNLLLNWIRPECAKGISFEKWHDRLNALSIARAVKLMSGSDDAKMINDTRNAIFNHMHNELGRFFELGLEKQEYYIDKGLADEKWRILPPKRRDNPQIESIW